MKQRYAMTSLAGVAFSATLLLNACGGRLQPGASEAGGAAGLSTVGGAGGAKGQGTGGSGATGGSTVGTGGQGAGGSAAGTGGQGAGGSAAGSGGSGAVGGAGGSGGTCQAGCDSPAGRLRDFASVDDVYAVVVGLWRICPTTGIAFDAPRDAIGVEYVTPNAGVVGDMFYLVQGATGPVRGKGFDYQRTYSATSTTGGFLLVMQRQTGNASATLRYSPCPEQLEVNVSGMVGRIARFP